jgi:hypothetical protein
MTEQDWLTREDPDTLARYLWWALDAVPPAPRYQRKFRLFATACCRLVWERLTDKRSRTAVELADQFMDDPERENERVAAAGRAFDAAMQFTTARRERYRVEDELTSFGFPPLGSRPDFEELAAQAAFGLIAWATNDGARAVELAMRALPTGRAAVALQLLRCQFGNPFRPVVLDPAWLGWSGGSVRELAEHIYLDRAFDLLPILGDALEDAGCAEATLLDHCRAPGPHARGCWVVDLLLGHPPARSRSAAS